MGKTCYQADPHQWGEGKTHLITEDGLATRCGRAIAVTPGRLVEAESYNCKACRAAKERDAAQLLREQQPRREWPSITERAREAQAWPQSTSTTSTTASATDFPMPFGKHRGTPVYDLDSGYLEWLRDNVELYGKLRAAVYAELEERGLEGGEDYR